MSNVLSTLCIDWQRLQEFTDDLEGILCMIAYAGFDNNIKFINEQREQLRKEYEQEINLIRGVPIFAFEMIERAWHSFDSAYFGTVEGLDIEAENIIQGNLIFDSEAIGDIRERQTQVQSL